MHNLIEIRQRVTLALEEVICEQGADGVSVSLIAQKANVSKALIYRYFGGVDDLLAYHIRESNVFPHFRTDYLEQLNLGHPNDAARVWFGQMIGFFRQLRSSKASRSVLQAGLAYNITLAETIEQTQHQELIHLVQRLSLLEQADNSATLAILQGGLYYLTLMAHHSQPMMGIDLRSETGWMRIEDAFKAIHDKLNQVPAPMLPFASRSDSARSQAA